MTDREKLAAFRAEIERLKDSCASPIVICDTLLSFIDSMQEEHVDYDKLNTMLDDALSLETKESWNERLNKKEPVTSVWHDASEEPEVGRAILLYGKDMCIPTKDFCAEYNKNYVIIQKSDKWAYLDDLLNLTHSVTKISDQEESEWLKELQEKLDSLSKEEFEKLLAKYDKYDEVRHVNNPKLVKALKEEQIMSITEKEIYEDYKRFIRHEAMRANCSQDDVLRIISDGFGKNTIVENVIEWLRIHTAMSEYEYELMRKELED